MQKQEHGIAKVGFACNIVETAVQWNETERMSKMEAACTNTFVTSSEVYSLCLS